MTAPDDLSDICDPSVAALVPEWLDLVTERLAVAGVRRSGAALNILLPEKLLLTMHIDDRSRWSVRAQSMIAIESLGQLGRPFSVVGYVSLPIEGSCGDPAAAAAALRPLLDIDTVLERLVPSDDSRLLDAWVHLRESRSF